MTSPLAVHICLDIHHDLLKSLIYNSVAELR